MAKRRRCVFGFCYSLLTILVYAGVSFSARSDKEVRERFYGNMMNSSAPVSGDGTIAKMFDRVLEKEFSENDQPEGSDGASFNSSVADQQAVLETVAKITHEKGKKNDTQVGNGTKPYDFEGVFSLENEDSEETTTLIDKKDTVFVMSWVRGVTTLECFVHIPEVGYVRYTDIWWRHVSILDVSWVRGVTTLVVSELRN